ncbi:MAG: hypothetical protein WBD49_19415, partial [Bradyrhizobium sp.]
EGLSERKTFRPIMIQLMKDGNGGGGGDPAGPRQFRAYTIDRRDHPANGQGRRAKPSYVAANGFTGTSDKAARLN